MKLIRNAAALAGGVVVLTTIACSHRDQNPNTASNAADQARSAGANAPSPGADTTITGAPMPSTPMIYETASARITDARCTHNIQCDQVGPNRRFATRDDCTSNEGQSTRDQLSASECPNGVDANRLQSCLAAISQKDCADLVVSLQTVDACRASAICLATPSP
ncbi:MAG: hypothetical protein JWP87_6421 [Labilithrix sp.]|nr:hypothetical protein [Labilithrix sp.]